MIAMNSRALQKSAPFRFIAEAFMAVNATNASLTLPG
jgi:hypothetical protein